jgi:hypothetical protein
MPRTTSAMDQLDNGGPRLRILIETRLARLEASERRSRRPAGDGTDGSDRASLGSEGLAENEHRSRGHQDGADSDAQPLLL